MKLRLTGISTPFFGASWEIKESEKSIAANLITFLEDKRIISSGLWGMLYLSSKGTEKSVQEIRQRIGQDLEKLDRNSMLADSLRELQTACREFLNVIELLRGKRSLNIKEEELIIRFRSVFAHHLMKVAVMYGFTLNTQFAVGLHPEEYTKGSALVELYQNFIFTKSIIHDASVSIETDETET